MRRVLPIGLGLVVGALTSIGQQYLDGPLNALVNSASAWLVVAFAVGACMRTWRGAALAGACACLGELAGYYVTAHARGYSAGTAILLFWTVCALVGGPVLGAAGERWRHGTPRLQALAIATAAGAFLAEGIWTYAYELSYRRTAALWLAIAAALVLALPGRRRLRAQSAAWLLVVLPVGLIAEAALTLAYNRSAG
ncbi:MAG TPA: DUF6518 family protein [Gaiellales bacterium]